MIFLQPLFQLQSTLWPHPLYVGVPLSPPLSNGRFCQVPSLDGHLWRAWRRRQLEGPISSVILELRLSRPRLGKAVLSAAQGTGLPFSLW